MPFQNLDRKAQILWMKRLAHILALLPLVLLFIDFWYYRLGPEPIRAGILRTGKWGLVLLLSSLAITPLNTLFGFKKILPWRKIFGVYSAVYITIHLSIFVGIDYGFDLRASIEEIIFRQYALVGFGAFLILIPLALTSTKWAMRKLGKNWKKLHRWVYLAGILGVVHFIWLVKNAYTRPGLYALVLFVLLALRLKPIKQQARKLQKQFKRRPKPKPAPSISK